MPKRVDSEGVELANGFDPKLPDDVSLEGIVDTFPALEFAIFTLRRINNPLHKSTDQEA